MRLSYRSQRTVGYQQKGCGRSEDSELTRSLCIAKGSASELECQMILLRHLGFLDSIEYVRLYDDLTM